MKPSRSDNRASAAFSFSLGQESRLRRQRQQKMQCQPWAGGIPTTAAKAAATKAFPLSLGMNPSLSGNQSILFQPRAGIPAAAATAAFSLSIGQESRPLLHHSLSA